MPAFTAFRSVVDPGDCDLPGHINVSRSLAGRSDAIIALEGALAPMSDDLRDRRSLSFVVVHADSDLLSGLRAGEAIRRQGDILAIGGKYLTFRHRLVIDPDECLFSDAVQMRCDAPRTTPRGGDPASSARRRRCLRRGVTGRRNTVKKHEESDVQN